jgi:hypothetical protein
VNRWTNRIRYDWWNEAILCTFGSREYWRYYRTTALQDIYRELMSDIIGCYCMGGEL